MASCTPHGLTNTTGTTRNIFRDDAEEVGRFKAPLISWVPCTKRLDFECGSVDVPLDYENPSGTHINIGLTRKPASNPAKRIGSLFINPGGPGEPGIQAAFALAYSLPTSVTDTFDIVGFDPRGVGVSAPLDCHNSEQLDKQRVNAYQIAEVRQAANSLKALHESCITANSELVRHLTTIETARDLYVLRGAVGDEKLTYLGFSYGTRLGAAYAQLFPHSVRAMVLDGAVGTTKQGFDDLFNLFLDSCENDHFCPLRNPSTATTTLLASLNGQPLQGTGVRSKQQATRVTFSTSVYAAMYDERLWWVLATAIDDANKGDGNLLIGLADGFEGRDPSGASSNVQNAHEAIVCADSTDRPSDQAIEDAIKRVTPSSPYRPVPGAECVGFPLSDHPLGPLKSHGNTPIIIVGTRNDPATPYENSFQLAKLVGGSHVVSWEGIGHTATTKTECIDTIVAKYFAGSEIPEGDPHCPSNVAVRGSFAPPELNPPNARSVFAFDKAGFISEFASFIVKGNISRTESVCATKNLVDHYEYQTLQRIYGEEFPVDFGVQLKDALAKCR